MNDTMQAIGYIVGGGLKENLHVRLSIPANQVQEGGFVVVESGNWLFYGLVTDLQLGATDPRFADEQSETRFPPQLAKLLHGQTLYTNLEVLPALMLERGPEPGSQEYDDWLNKLNGQEPRPGPVKTTYTRWFASHQPDCLRRRGKPRNMLATTASLATGPRGST